MPKHKEIATDENNDTELHLKLRNGGFDEIKTFLDKTDDKMLSKMARMVNDENLLPLHVIGRNQRLDERQKKIIVSRIIAYATYKKYKSLSEPIEPQKILRNFEVSTDRPTLIRNIELGCKLVNDVRAKFKNSPTHPHTNACTPAEKNSIIHAVDVLRWKIACIQLEIKNLEADEKTKLQQFLKRVAQAAMETGQFSCHEAAQIAQHFLQVECDRLNIEIPSELLQIPTADHILLAIDYPGPDAVLCDPWSGKVMPDTEEAKLRSLKGHFTIFQHRLPEITGVQVPLKDNKSCLEMMTFFNPKVNKFRKDVIDVESPVKLPNFCRLFAACVVSAAVGVFIFMGAQNTMQRPE